MVTPIFQTPDGKVHPVEVEPGITLMEAARDNNVPGIVPDFASGATRVPCPWSTVSPSLPIGARQ